MKRSTLAILVLLFALQATYCAFAQATTNLQIPEPRWVPYMCYDDTRKQIILFGGGGKEIMLGDTWILKNNTWKKLSDTGPSPRNKGAFAYDANRKRAVLFGGNDGNDKLVANDTWEWDGKSWTKASPANSPVTRAHCMSAYDYQSKKVILFGGFGPSGILKDTWTYDGTSWELVNADGPPDCLPHGIIYDESKGKVLLITMPLNSEPGDPNHRSNKVWEWTGSSWKIVPGDQLATSNQSLQALSSFTKGKIILFDGDDITNGCGKTWTYSQNHWISVVACGPSPRVGHTMVYDRRSKRTILFGGSDRKKLFNDTWTWDGQNWSRLRIE